MQPHSYAVDLRINLLESFVSKNRHGSNNQIIVASDVFLKALSGRALPSVATEQAQIAFDAVGAAEALARPVERHFAAPVSVATMLVRAA